MTSAQGPGAGGDEPPSDPALAIEVLTIFPGYLGPLREALVGKAIDGGLVSVGVHDLREWTHDVHRAVDDAPYGGGPGMLMKPQVWGEALDDVLARHDDPILIVPTPAGRPFTQATAQRWSRESSLIFACGRYEGIDQRVMVDAARRVRVEEVSIGDYVLVGGEAAVLVICEAVIRLIPGVLGNQRSHQEDSFSDGMLEGPAYTRPRVWRDLEVPPILLSGDHARIARWRAEQGRERTVDRRPDLPAGSAQVSGTPEPAVHTPAAAEDTPGDHRSVGDSR